MSVETLTYSQIPVVENNVPQAFLDAFEPKAQGRVNNFTSIDSQKLMQDVGRLRWLYYSSLGMEHEMNVVRNFDPPLLRAMWEQLKTPEEQRMFITQQIEENIPTALGERYSVVESEARYTVNPRGKLYSQSFPNEPFEGVVKRGVEHSKNLGTPDVDREDAQLKGILSVQEVIANDEVPPNLKMVFISGPSFKKGTVFTKNFVDVYEFINIDPVTKIRHLQMTRFTSSATYEQYEANVRAYRPAYFSNKKADDPVDSYYAENGIKIDPKVDTRSATEIFIQPAGAARGVLSKENLQKIIDGSKARMSYFMEAVCAGVFDPHEVALRWNAILAGADRIRDELLGIPQKIVRGITNFIKNTPIFRTIAEEVNWLGRQTIEVVAAACGLSGGFSLGNIGKSIISLVSGIWKRIRNIFGSTEHKWFVCPKCDYHANGPVGDTCPSCDLTKEGYSQSGGQVC